MAWKVRKRSSMMSSYPKSLWILILAGGFVLFWTFVSFVFVSYPIGSKVSWYFYGLENTERIDLSLASVKETDSDYRSNKSLDAVNSNATEDEESSASSKDPLVNSNDRHIDEDLPSELCKKTHITSTDMTITPEHKEVKQKIYVPECTSVEKQMTPSGHSTGQDLDLVDKSLPLLIHQQDPRDSSQEVPTESLNLINEHGAQAHNSSSSITNNMDLGKNIARDSVNESHSMGLISNSTSIQNSSSKLEELQSSLSEVPNVESRNHPIASDCELFHGNWIYDSSGPLYVNKSCPVLTQMQNCQSNGRPDKDYENWRWKPSQCDLPRFDPKKFLELMRGKTLAFIGDSVARNHMESLLCMLGKVETPKNRGNRNMQRYYFRSTSVMIIRIWSSWLVQPTNEALDFAPRGVDKLHLDIPDQKLMEYIPSFDVIVVSSGHWFAKQSVYVLNNTIVGAQLWSPEKSKRKRLKVNNVEAFGISIETFLTALVRHPNYKGLTILRTFSPDHYEGGAWNTGGSCTGKVKPLAPDELVHNGFTNIMHEKQVAGFTEAIKKITNRSKLKLMDITEAFSYRHDGHPGPYRSPDPNKITQRGPDGRPPPQDCLHWCMPGPVDIWNEFVLEIIRREYEDGSKSV